MNRDPFIDYACCKYLFPYLPFHIFKVIYEEEKKLILIWPSVFIFSFMLSAFHSLSPKLGWSSHTLPFGSLIWNLFCVWCKVVNQLFFFIWICNSWKNKKSNSTLFIEKSISSLLCKDCYSLPLIYLSLSHCFHYFCFIISNNIWWNKTFTLLFSSFRHILITVCH